MYRIKGALTSMNDEMNKTDSTEQPISRTLTSDSAGLRGLCGGLIGGVYEVNGEGALEAPEFVPTCHELEVIARHWLRRAIDIEFFFYCTEQNGSTDDRVKSFARRRLGRIRQILGDAYRKLDLEVKAEVGADVDPRLWKMFLNGVQPERGRDGLPVLHPTECPHCKGPLGDANEQDAGSRPA
jgi:hypothetical protein